MKPHSQFTSELYAYLNARHPNFGKAFNAATANEIVKMTRHGVAPVGGLMAEEPAGQERVDAAERLVKVVEPLLREAAMKPSGFAFGAASKAELVGVNAELQRCVQVALTYCAQDFCVYDGIRTYKEQQAHVRDGTSKTMQSKHLQGLAVDLVPWVNGSPKWDWNLIWPIAYAMDRAATDLGIANRITWGGAWDRRLSDFGGDVNEYERIVKEYEARHPGKDFIDGPHFEILPA